MKDKFIKKIYLSSLVGNQMYSYLSKFVLYNLRTLNSDYPDFDNWYNNKVLTGISLKQREVIIYAVKGSFAGVCILKNDTLEKKISTIRVLPKYQKNGIGDEMFQDAFKILETEKPIITIPENRYFQFKKLVMKYNFKLDNKSDMYLRNNNKELFFNF